MPRKQTKSNLKKRANKIMMRSQYQRVVMKKLKELKEERNKVLPKEIIICPSGNYRKDKTVLEEFVPKYDDSEETMMEEDVFENCKSVEENEYDDSIDEVIDDISIMVTKNTLVLPPIFFYSDKVEMNIQEESESSQETEEWEEVPVPSRRGMVEAVPPEDEPLTEEEERLKVLLENFHLSKREDDCIITRVVRQSKLTEFFDLKKK